MKSILILGLVAAVAPSAGAGQRHAQQQASRNAHWARVLQSLDLNHDGKVSRAEYAAGPDQTAALDHNRDGVITPDEIGTGGKGHEAVVRWFQRADRDRDQKVSMSEITAIRNQRFDRLDRARNGYLIVPPVGTEVPPPVETIAGKDAGATVRH